MDVRVVQGCVPRDRGMWSGRRDAAFSTTTTTTNNTHPPARPPTHPTARTHLGIQHKQQAVYGRIEGMYTRSQLMASLAEQKEHTLRLVGKVDELAGGLGDMEVRSDGTGGRKTCMHHVRIIAWRQGGGAAAEVASPIVQKNVLRHDGYSSMRPSPAAVGIFSTHHPLFLALSLLP